MKTKKETKVLEDCSNVFCEEVVCKKCGHSTYLAKFDEEIEVGEPFGCKGCEIIDDLKKNIKIALKDKEFVQVLKETIEEIDNGTN